jgi:hypothetical protein
MAAELKDLKRLKITNETAAWLNAESHSTGRKKHEIARDALHEIAVSKIRAAKVLASMAPAEDRTGDTQDHGRDSGARRR